jgi:hypothetical protein
MVAWEYDVTRAIGALASAVLFIVFLIQIFRDRTRARHMGTLLCL